MSGKVVNRVRPGFYLDSVALMRIAQAVQGLEGVENAALMIGTPANKEILANAGLLAEAGRAATPADLIVAVRAEGSADRDAALARAEALLHRPSDTGAATSRWRPRTLRTALEALPEANLALISVPGTFAAGEARSALRAGLHVMLFSDNVSLADEVALKREAAERGLLLMGPDCGTALIAGVPLAFANAVPRGPVGIVSASGTGLQEVSCLLARAGSGVSHGIGTGGRDLHGDVGGLTMLAAIDALEADSATEHVVLISKPPAARVAEAVLKRVARSRKPFTVCFLGLDSLDLPSNATLAPTLHEAAERALGRSLAAADDSGAAGPAMRAGRVEGLFSGGTLCAEAQTIFRRAGAAVASNVPVPGAVRWREGVRDAHTLLDLGADEFTVGRPHPMIDPSARSERIREALADAGVAVLLLDVVLGYGAHPDPAGALVEALPAGSGSRPPVVVSVCGTDADPQHRASQVQRLRDAGVHVAGSAAAAAALALRLAGGGS